MRRFSLWLALVVLAIALVPGSTMASSGQGDAHRAQQALQRAEDLSRGIGVRTGRELTPALAELYRNLGALSPADRKKGQSLLARPTDTEAAPGHAYSVPEAATPECGVHFCIHYVTTTVDAPNRTDADNNGFPDYVDLMSQVFENEVFPCENGTAAFGCADAATTGLGWPQAPSDGVLGGDARFDVYIEDLFPSSVFGFVSVDREPGGASLHSYLVMDKDFSRFSQTLTGAQEMRVTAAHEYNHVLQFGIDANEDTWMFESTATFFENQVYPAIDDYLSYLPTWVDNTDAPLTDASAGGGLKMYGSAVWNHFIAGRHGAKSILDAWQAKVQENGGSFAPSSYGVAIAANGGTGFNEEFDDFAAAVAEWRAPGSGFPDLYPDVPAAARPNMAVGAAAATFQLDHTAFTYRNVTPPAGAGTTLTLNATLPAGLRGAIALVGRTGGSSTGGTVTKVIQRLSNGGPATVSLPNAETFGRITAVLVNADASHGNFNSGQNDWNFTKDNQNFTGVQVTSGPPPTSPIVSTDAAGSIALTSATLNATINPNGLPTTYFFEYGPTTSYGSQSPAVPAAAGSASTGLRFSTAVSGLARGTTYHYRVVANNTSGTTAGSDATFTTLDPPIVSTSAASSVAIDGATLNATVNPRGRATTYVFQYGPTVAYGKQIPLVAASAGGGTGDTPVAQALSGLAQGTTIHYRVVATNADGTTNGGDQSFKTLDPPVVTTGGAGAISSSGAVLTGSVDGRAKPTTFIFEYGETLGYGDSITGSAGTGSGPISEAGQVTGLKPGTLYHFRLTATNADGTVSGADATFTTTATGAAGGTTAPTGTAGTTGTTGSTSPTPLSLSLTLKKAKLRSALKKGLTAQPRCSAACSVTVKVVLSPKVAKKLKLKPTLVNAKAPGGALVRLRFSKKAIRALARIRKVALEVTVSARTPDGRTAALTKNITLAR